LIQRFTTSNPSRDYLHRVATTFKQNEGHLGETLKAILLDPEARNLDLSNPTFGMKKSPLEALIQAVIALECSTTYPLTPPTDADDIYYGTKPGDYSDTRIYLDHYGYPEEQFNNHRRNVRFFINTSYLSDTALLGMAPFRAPSVFNYYLPDYTKQGVIQDAGLVAPELQLATEPAVMQNINYMRRLVSGGFFIGAKMTRHEELQEILLGLDPNNYDNLTNLTVNFGRLTRDLYPTDTVATDTRTAESLADEGLVDALDKRLMSGMFKLQYPYSPDDADENPREVIIDYLTDNFEEAEHQTKLKEALYLMINSPSYQIRK